MLKSETEVSLNTVSGVPDQYTAGIFGSLVGVLETSGLRSGLRGYIVLAAVFLLPGGAVMFSRLLVAFGRDFRQELRP